MGLPHLCRGIDAELVGERAAKFLVHGQGVGLAAGRVQRAHAQRGQPFPERVFCGERLQVGQDPGVVTESQLRIETVFEGADPEFLQARARPGRERGVAHVGEGGALPQRERRAERCGRFPRQVRC
ncbi:hypothetical protein SAMN05216215_101371 [Saccharopolyspora shandongensis]|uniref:Uncharacterized protein n=1 Tax=Saccharopolyspora shandongensis TaxID=418495 RepID=A0A1H3DDY6_9PSEU|nr:hypothetical protein SAMN05216215_101371 [Saccharopolyspora shandongensis]